MINNKKSVQNKIIILTFSFFPENQNVQSYLDSRSMQIRIEKSIQKIIISQSQKTTNTKILFCYVTN